MRKGAYLMPVVLCGALAFTTATVWARTNLSCIAPNKIELDTLAEGVVEVTEINWHDSVVSVDTISQGQMIGEMVGIFDSVSYCYVAHIDTVITPPELPYAGNGPGIALWRVESTLVVVDTVLKGSTPESFWLVDTISNIMVLAKRSVVLNSYQSFRGLQGRSFLFFGNSPTDVRASSALLRLAGMCEAGPTGFFVDENNMITKTGNATIGRKDYPGIQVPLQDLVDALTAEYSIRYIGDVINCFVYPCPGFVVTNVRTGGTVMATALKYQGVFEEGNTKLLKATNYYRGFFDTKNLEAWGVWSTVFIITEVLQNAPILVRSAGAFGGGRGHELEIRMTDGGAGLRILLERGAKESTEATFTLYDAAGRAIRIAAVGGRRSFVVPTEHLTAGVYVAEVRTGRSAVTKRFTLRR